MQDSLSAVLAAFLAATGAQEVHAARVSNGPKAGWTTRIRLLVPETAISAQTPPGFAGTEIAAGPDGQALRDALAPLLPDGTGAGARAFVAARGAWLLLDPQAPRLAEIDPAGALPRAEADPEITHALASADIPEGHWRSDETSAHARLAANSAFTDLRRHARRPIAWPDGGVLHLLRAGRARALLHAPGPQRIRILALAHVA